MYQSAHYNEFLDVSSCMSPKWKPYLLKPREHQKEEEKEKKLALPFLQ